MSTTICWIVRVLPAGLVGGLGDTRSGFAKTPLTHLNMAKALYGEEEGWRERDWWVWCLGGYGTGHGMKGHLRCCLVGGKVDSGKNDRSNSRRAGSLDRQADSDHAATWRTKAQPWWGLWFKSHPLNFELCSLLHSGGKKRSQVPKGELWMGKKC